MLRDGDEERRDERGGKKVKMKEEKKRKWGKGKEESENETS